MNEVNIISLLGLAENVAEVLDQVEIKDKDISSSVRAFICEAAILGCAKNKFTQENIANQACISSETSPKDRAMSEKAFEKALADTFYYLQALASSRGLTIEDLTQIAQMSYKQAIKRKNK